MVVSVPPFPIMEGFPLLDTPALISAAIFSREKIRLQLQILQVSFAGCPVSKFGF